MAGRVAVPYPQMIPEARYQSFIGGCALVGLLTAPWWIYQLFVATHGLEYFFDSGDVIVSAVTIPSVIAINLAAFFLLSGNERWVRPIIATGLALKVASTAAYLYFTMEVYKGSADLSHYLWIGKQLAVAYDTMG